ncbi:MAG TPA: tyrosine--tRNA ligase [Candidatus Paceibacterota bacterium]|nr:tyrosine--tRNA ligase [Candidatus Paceibacterota bacterium]
MTKLSEVLRERGYVYQFSSETLEEITDGPKRTVYLGIDPTADSMHVGHLSGLLVLRRFLEDGHKVIILTGGGTGMIGDPGGKSEERNLLDEATISHNAAAVAVQIKQVFGTNDFIAVNNDHWLSKLKLIEFLRDIGKHFTINAMIKRDVVRNRLDAESPISFTEFSYSLLQGFDFLHLNEEYSCDVQVGGSDQWSNILSGVEFIRRKTGRTVYAFTWPLIINKSTGKKFGKSEGGAVWLDVEKTSPFQFYQFWFNTEDEAVEEYLLKMTLLSKEEIAAIVADHILDSSRRIGQKALAREVTALVHGKEVASVMGAVSEVLFGDATAATLDSDVKDALLKEAPNCKIDIGDNILDVLIKSELASSKREAREFVEQKAISLNGEKISDVSRSITNADIHNGFALLRRGKQRISLLTLA